MNAISKKHGLILALLSMMINQAQADGLGDLDARLKRADTLASVEVTIETDRYDRVERLPLYPCAYTTGDPRKISNLLQLFAEQNTNRMPKNQVFLPWVEIQVHFVFNDGNTDILYLGRRYLGERTVDGELQLKDRATTVFLWVGRDISERILDWARQADEVIGHQAYFSHQEDFQRICWEKIKVKNLSVPDGRN